MLPVPLSYSSILCLIFGLNQHLQLLYHFSMAHGYWRCGRHSLTAVFQLYFRSCPLAGEFTLFAGLQDCLAFLAHFQLSSQDVGFLRTVLPPDTERGFYEYLQGVTAEGVTVRAVPEGSVVFPQVPLLEVEGPLAVVQMLETPLLTLVNYASLVATNAARMRLATGDGRRLLEMGLRRAQGPDGGLSASRYSYIGGFDATSNVLAGKLYDIPLFGSLAHSYITSFTSLSDVTGQTLVPAGGAGAARDLVSLCRRWLSRVCTFLSLPEDQVNMSELAAFISYAASSPNNFVGLVDTYSVVRSGVPNFCAVSLALDELGYRAQGVRVDSGDLLCLSLTVRSTLRLCADRFSVPWFSHIPIIVTNDITEKDLVNLQLLPNAVDSVGVGTNLVTCPLQPSLGCVYKLTQVSGTPRIKLTEDKDKMTLPGKKTAYRLFGQDDSPILDLLTLDDELLPGAGEEISCHVLSRGGERVSVRAARVECLHHVYYKDGQITMNLPTTAEIRSHAQRSLNNLPLKHKHLQEPVPYQVAVSTRLQQVLREVMEEGVPNPGQAPPCPTSLSVAASS